MKYKEGDKVKIVKPNDVETNDDVSYSDSTSSAKNCWNDEMDRMNGMEVTLDDWSNNGWRIPLSAQHRPWYFLEDWLQRVEDHNDAYDRAMSIF